MAGHGGAGQDDMAGGVGAGMLPLLKTQQKQDVQVGRRGSASRWCHACAVPCSAMPWRRQRRAMMEALRSHARTGRWVHA